MIAMGMMQPSTHQVIDVIAMGHRLMPAGWPMLVRAAGLRRALHGIGGVDRDRVLIDMILVRVMQVAIMEIIGMAIVLYRSMATVGAVLVTVSTGMLLVSFRHQLFLSQCDSGPLREQDSLFDSTF